MQDCIVLPHVAAAGADTTAASVQVQSWTGVVPTNNCISGVATYTLPSGEFRTANFQAGHVVSVDYKSGANLPFGPAFTIICICVGHAAYCKPIVGLFLADCQLCRGDTLFVSSVVLIPFLTGLQCLIPCLTGLQC